LQSLLCFTEFGRLDQNQIVFSSIGKHGNSNEQEEKGQWFNESQTATFSICGFFFFIPLCMLIEHLNGVNV